MRLPRLPALSFGIFQLLRSPHPFTALSTGRDGSSRLAWAPRTQGMSGRANLTASGVSGGGGQLRVLGAFHPSAVFQGPQGLQGRRGPPGLGGMQVNDVRVLSCIAEVHTCELGKELLSPIPACFSAGSGWDGGVLRSQRRRCKNFFPTFGLWWGWKLGSRASLQGAPSPGGCAAFWLYKHRAGVADAGVPLAGHRGGPWNEGTTRTGGTCGESMEVNDRVGGGPILTLKHP